MSLIIVSDIAKLYGSEVILSQVSFRVENGDRIGLVGANGSGKSTLLNILTGNIEADNGSVVLARGVRLGYLPQVPDFAGDLSAREELRRAFDDIHAAEDEMQDIAAGFTDPDIMNDPEIYQELLDRYAALQEKVESRSGYTTEYRVQATLDGLGFTAEQQDIAAESLSGGQQTRISLGKLLLGEPDILLLDEPTNHLDLHAIEWLEEYLREWKGAIIIVSHDRYFLDSVCAKVLEVENTHVEEFPGNYTKYVLLKNERRVLQQKAYEKQQDEIARTEEFIRRYRAGQRAKEARGRQKMLDRLERIDRPFQSDDLHFSIRAAYESGEKVLQAKDIVIGFTNGSPLFTVPSLEIDRGDRIGVIGPNGSGKTTLLRAIVDELPPLSGALKLGHNVRIGYYAQTHETLNPRNTVLREISEDITLSEEAVRTFMGRFQFTGNDVFKTIDSLSGGERARIALAKLTLQGANFLILDEPTNHLDLPARQFLEEALKEYDGTLLFTSHDRYFLDALAEKIWIVGSGSLKIFNGNYSDYHRKTTAQSEKNSKEQQAKRKTAQAASSRVISSAASAKPARTLEMVESEINRQEQLVATLETELIEVARSADRVRIKQAGAAYEEAKNQLEALYAEWEELA